VCIDLGLAYPRPDANHRANLGRARSQDAVDGILYHDALTGWHPKPVGRHEVTFRLGLSHSHEICRHEDAGK
jgi:hypothetical protein